ncbi:MAG: PHP domain-containing protein [Euryarchaeota archaeon]|nr:PHP domain-containing protein [Euryarchaeota archaeon]
MRFDLHVHSCFSKDSDADPDSILEWAQRNGLDGLAICDHDTVEGGLACIRRAKEIGSRLTVIPGIEVTSSEGHILVLGVTENIEPGLTPQQTIERARQLGGLVIIPHPFKVTSHGIGYVEGLDVDAVEVLNSRCVTMGPNRKAQKAAAELHLPQVGGSDAHEARMVGCTFTDIDAAENTLDSVLDAIRKGHVSAGGKLTPMRFVVKQMIRGAAKKIKRGLRI